jgi:hypothetical protein
MPIKTITKTIAVTTTTKTITVATTTTTQPMKPRPYQTGEHDSQCYCSVCSPIVERKPTNHHDDCQCGKC